MTSLTLLIISLAVLAIRIQCSSSSSARERVCDKTIVGTAGRNAFVATAGPFAFISRALFPGRFINVIRRSTVAVITAATNHSFSFVLLDEVLYHKDQAG